MLLLFTFLFSLNTFAAISLDSKDNVLIQRFINEVSSTQSIPKKWLEAQFQGLHTSEQAISFIQKPRESLTWHKYRKLFLTKKRIEKGRIFLERHTDLFTSQERQYGIPKSIVAAIIGMETNYGLTKGDFNALEVLSTLSFYYVPRHRFFQTELKALITEAWHKKWDLHQVKASYAGALGIPQFMPSNIPLYSKSADAKLPSNIFNNPLDAISSVFNYLHAHGHWHANQPVLKSIKLTSHQYAYLMKNHPGREAIELTPKLRKILNLRRQGEPTCWLLLSKHKNYREAFIGFHNFASIMRYNNSAHYAHSVYDLAMTF